MTLRWQALRAGDALPELATTLSVANMALYSAATWDFIRIHYDAEYARTRGLPGPIVDGQMLGGYLASLLWTWAGPDAELRSLGFRNRAPVYAGDRLRVAGTVVEVDAATPGGLVHCSLTMHNQNDVAVLSDAAGTIWFPDLGS